MRGRLSGGFGSVSFTGQSLSPVASQPLVSAHGYASLFLAAGLALVAVAVVLATGARLAGAREAG